MIKNSSHQKDTTILNVYSTNHRASRYRKQNLTEPNGEREKPAVTCGKFNTPLLVTGTSRQRISKDIEDLNSLREPSTQREQNTLLFLGWHKTLTERDHLLGDKTNQNKIKRIKIIVFIGHNRIKWETNNTKSDKS